MDDLDTQEPEVDTPEAEESFAPKSMDDTIRDTLAAIESRGSEEETPEQIASRQRDEKGRFARNAAPEQTPDATSAAPAEAQPDPVAAPITVPPEIQRLGLRKDEAEAFAAASPAVRDAFLRRSEEMHRGLENYRSKAQFGHAMEQALSPFQQTMQQLGVTPDQAVTKLMRADHNLRYGSPEQKQQMLAQIAQDYGVNLGEGFQLPQVDPNVSFLQQRLQALEGSIEQRNQQEQQREAAELNSQIAKFAADPSHKHYEAVRNEMAGLLQSGLAETLQDAYDKAIYANPQTRALVLAEQQAQAETQRRNAAAQRAQEAKKASAVNITRRGVVPVRRPVGTMDETIRAEAERLGLL